MESKCASGEYEIVAISKLCSPKTAFQSELFGS